MQVEACILNISYKALSGLCAHQLRVHGNEPFIGLLFSAIQPLGIPCRLRIRNLGQIIHVLRIPTGTTDAHHCGEGCLLRNLTGMEMYGKLTMEESLQLDALS